MNDFTHRPRKPSFLRLKVGGVIPGLRESQPCPCPVAARARVWAPCDADLQRHGQQTEKERNYIMEFKPEKGLCIYFHDEEPTRNAGGPVPRCYHDILMHATWEQDTDMVRRTEINCDHGTSMAPPRPPGVHVDSGGDLNVERLPQHPDPTQ